MIYEIYFVARNPSVIHTYHPKGKNDDAFIVTSCEIYSRECWVTCIFQNVLCLFKFRYVFIANTNYYISLYSCPSCAVPYDRHEH